MEDNRSDEQKAIWAGITALFNALPPSPRGGSARGRGDHEEHPYGVGGATLYRTESFFAADQLDGTSTKYEVKVEVIKSVDSHDDYWRQQLADRNRALVINGVHYRIGNSNGVSGWDFKGFGGRKFEIQYLAADDQDPPEPFIVDDLWYQGPIPPKYRMQLPDNARFVKPGQEPFRRD